MWLRAVGFSMQVLRENKFKVVIPAFFLGLFFVFMNAAIAYWFVQYSYSAFPEVYDLFVIVPLFLIVLIVSGILYKTVYPLFRNYVLFLGLKEQSSSVEPCYKDYRSFIHRNGLWGNLQKISMKRFRSQLFSFGLLLITPVIVFFVVIGIGSLWPSFHFIPNLELFIIALILLSYIFCCIPVYRGYFRYFFGEVDLLHRSLNRIPDSSQGDDSSELLIDTIRGAKKSVGVWKIMLLALYLVVVALLVLLLLQIQFGSFANYSVSDYIVRFVNKGALGFFFHFLVPFLFVPFFFQGSVNSGFHGITINLFVHPINPFIQFVFIVLLGLITAFFILLETLSTVYFYKQMHLHETR